MAGIVRAGEPKNQEAAVSSAAPFSVVLSFCCKRNQVGIFPRGKDLPKRRSQFVLHQHYGARHLANQFFIVPAEKKMLQTRLLVVHDVPLMHFPGVILNLIPFFLDNIGSSHKIISVPSGVSGWALITDNPRQTG